MAEGQAGVAALRTPGRWMIVGRGRPRAETLAGLKGLDDAGFRLAEVGEGPVEGTTLVILEVKTALDRPDVQLLGRLLRELGEILSVDPVEVDARLLDEDEGTAEVAETEETRHAEAEDEGR